MRCQCYHPRFRPRCSSTGGGFFAFGYASTLHLSCYISSTPQGVHLIDKRVIVPVTTLAFPITQGNSLTLCHRANTFSSNDGPTAIISAMIHFRTRANPHGIGWMYSFVSIHFPAGLKPKSIIVGNIIYCIRHAYFKIHINSSAGFLSLSEKPPHKITLS